MNWIKVKKKPVEVEAIQNTFQNQEIGFFDKLFEENNIEFWASGKITIKTLEGNMECKLGDYIIKGVKGEIYPCRKDIFEETYEEIEEC